MENRGEWIARRAYALWEEAGRPFGQDKYHWDQASAKLRFIGGDARIK